MALKDLISSAGSVLALLAAAATLLVAFRAAVRRRGAAGRAAYDPHAAAPAIFLFDQDYLVDATERGRRLLAHSTPVEGPWRQLVELLGHGFGDIGAALRDLPRGERLDLEGQLPFGPARLRAEWRNGLLRLTILEPEDGERTLPVEASKVHSMERDAHLLAAISDHAPGPIWATDGATGAVTWANTAYAELAIAARGEAAATAWPPPRIFDLDGAALERPRRVQVLRAEDEPPAWYEVSGFDLGAGPGGQRIHFATPVDAAVRAESTMRDVVQTLAKTFAHLPIGLAIFDRNRRLALFNPALTDLSGLPAEFLGDRPTLAAFLDELRNRQVMAEPKDYRSWRQMITHLEAEASRGRFAETWSLPDGRTFRVTGRPHPEGAIAFLFEDITDEITLTRRFRKDLQLGQAILDELPMALAVFSRGGTLVLANAAFARLWDMDPATTLGEVSIVDCMRRWIEAAQPSPAWGDLRDFVTTIGGRSAWTADIERIDGRRFELRCTPLPAGDTLVAFAEIPARPAGVAARDEVAQVRPA